ncbi:unnamed protein product [Echinostoma caproni]|uniref:Uncharacterized protein n=1 Tax=Echinostoma caproni TaxID=27848 RepID=A0A3P8GQ45_9TREM|nr:unnamed protein product [Echinostoma caproni]
MAREHDPSNSRVAQLLAEQEEEERRLQAMLKNDENTYWDDEEGERCPPISRDDSAETFHRLMADAAETAARAMAESASEEDEEGDEADEDEVVIDDDSLFDPCLVLGNDPAVDPLSINSSNEKVMGTATAASTKRRQDAIAQLIQSAANRSKSTGGSTNPSEENSLTTPTQVTSTSNTNSEPSSSASCSAATPALADGITWLLASDLYDCHTQLSKLQSQMRVLEQRLTAQEAAADEAIERLCLQCRHVEFELNEARQRLQTYLQVQQNGAEARDDGDYTQVGNLQSPDALHSLLSNVNNNIAAESRRFPQPVLQKRLVSSGHQISSFAFNVLGFGKIEDYC